MAYKITEECINCGACEPECPNAGDHRRRHDLRHRPGEMHGMRRQP